MRTLGIWFTSAYVISHS